MSTVVVEFRLRSRFRGMDRVRKGPVGVPAWQHEVREFKLSSPYNKMDELKCKCTLVVLRCICMHVCMYTHTSGGTLRVCRVVLALP